MKPRASASFCHCPNESSTPPGHVGPSCVSRPDGQAGDDIVGAGAIDRRQHRRLVVQSGDVAQAHRMPARNSKRKKS